LTIPEWTREDYINTQTPFEWLYQFKDNKFKLAQMLAKIKKQAGAVGISNFIAIWNAYLQTVQSKQGITTDNVTEFDGQAFELLTGDYKCDEYGITVLDKYGFEIIVCNHPIMPIQRLTNIDTGEEKMQIAYKRGKNWRTLIVDKAVLASSTKILDLASYGLAVNSENSKHIVKYLTEVEHLNYESLPEQNSVGRLGWIADHGFSPYVDSLVFDGDLSFKHAFESVKESGDYNKWLEAVKKVRKSSMIARIMLASSFASVLVEPCDALPFFVHLWGGTEAGKTVALMLAASVWASPRMGDYIVTFNSTTVARELYAGFMNNLPLCLDELQIQNGEKRDFDRDIYRLTEGVGRVRGAKAGGLQRTVTWKNCILTNGEMPITSSSSGGGAVNRIIEIDCKEEQLFEDPKEFVTLVTKNYGFAGKEFVSILQEPGSLEYARTIQRVYHRELSCGDTTEKQAISASIILTADRLINEWIFKDEQIISACDLAQYLTSKNEVSQNDRCHEWVYSFIAMNMSRFEPNAGEAWGCIDENYIYFIKSVFDQKMQENGYNATAYLSWAKRNGYIEYSENETRATKRKRIKGSPQPVWCVWFKVTKEELPEDKEKLQFVYQGKRICI